MIHATKHIVIVAGEASGDLHAASVVSKLLINNPNLTFSGIGGSQMQQVGVNLLFDLASFGITGLSGVLRHAHIVHQALRTIKSHLVNNPPDLLILVDYPGFNLNLAHFAKFKLNLRILYYISPQIWAWKAKRIERIRACVDHMAVILPFEKLIYQQENIPVSFVGHPLVQDCLQKRDITALRLKFQIPQDARLLAILPGSRLHEIAYHMPVIIQALTLIAANIPRLHVIIPVATTIKHSLITNYFNKSTVPYTLVTGEAVDVMACSDVVIVASGTASLECALLKKPMCIVYKGSWLSYAAAMHFIQVRYFGLSNLLLGGMIVPELLQYDFNVTELVKVVTPLFSKEQQQRFNRKLETLVCNLSIDNADCTLDNLIMLMLDPI